METLKRQTLNALNPKKSFPIKNPFEGFQEKTIIFGIIETKKSS